MKYLTFTVSRICTNGCFKITNRSYISLQKGAVYKKEPLEKLILPFQYCHYSSIDMTYITNFTKKTINFQTSFQTTKEILPYRLTYQQFSDQNIGKKKIPKMTRQHFQQTIFCKWLTHVTLICNYKVVIGAYSRNWTNC